MPAAQRLAGRATPAGVSLEQYPGGVAHGKDPAEIADRQAFHLPAGDPDDVLASVFEMDRESNVSIFGNGQTARITDTNTTNSGAAELIARPMIFSGCEDRLKR